MAMMGYGLAIAAQAHAAARKREAEEAERRGENRVKLTQWRALEGMGYSAMPEGKEFLPPGMYDLTLAQSTIVFIPIQTRTDELIRFPDSVSDAVVTEIETFWQSGDVFAAHDLPWKRGILLYGPPGSGKTCTLQLLSRDVIARGGVVILFDYPDLFVNAYRQLREIQPDTPVVVFMEDIDALLENHSETKILNLLDGVERVEKVVFLATTNYPHKLGARIINRPSRFDRRFNVPHPSAVSRRIYLETLVKDGEMTELEMAQMVADTQGMSLAHLKEVFVSVVVLKNSYEQTIKLMQGMFKSAVSDMEQLDDSTMKLQGLDLRRGYV